MTTPAERLAYHLERRGADIQMMPPHTGSSYHYLRIQIKKEDGTTPAMAAIAFDLTTGRARRFRNSRLLHATVIHGPNADCAHPANLREFMAALAPYLPYTEVWHPTGNPFALWTVYQVPADKAEAARESEEVAADVAVSTWDFDVATGWSQIV